MADRSMTPSPFGNIGHPLKRVFLAAFAETGRYVEAARLADVNRNMHYHWMKDENYAQAFEIARSKAMLQKHHRIS